jgi:hypothetical protein
MRGWEHFRNARTELLEGEGDDRVRLLYAARAFRAALDEYEEWPAHVRAKADELRSRLGVDRPMTGRGPIAETLAQMDDESLRAVCDDLWQFCEFAVAP